MMDRLMVLLLTVNLVQVRAKVSAKVNPEEWNQIDVGLNAVEIIEKNGYPCETHYIVTEDEYILGTQRIPYGRVDQEPGNRPAVILQHGVMSSSAAFVDSGPDRALALVLADLGYDVWLPNARGNFWSRNHTTLDPDLNKKKFWDFSWHEMGIYDLPACIDYVLGTTGQESLYYIGHSEGATELVVLLSIRPEYNKRIRIASLMAPPVFFQNNNNSMYQLVSKHVKQIQYFLNYLGVYEVPFTNYFREWSGTHCADPKYAAACITLFNRFTDTDDTEQLETSRIGEILTNYPAGAAIKQYVHFAQLIRSGGFKVFDYGPQKNFKLYRTAEAPHYDLTKITTPVAVYYGLKDIIVNYRDAELLCAKLPHVVNQYLVPYPKFNHADFLRAIEVVPLVYNELISFMQKY